jgi:hypothetical protein
MSAHRPNKRSCFLCSDSVVARRCHLDSALLLWGQTLPACESTTHEARTILAALRQLTDNPVLRAEASYNAEGVLDQLGLNGVARYAVLFGMAAIVATPIATSQLAYWQ